MRRLNVAATILGGMLAVTAAGLTVVGVTAVGAEAEAAATAQPAPGFEVKTLAGEPLRLADLRGRVVVLLFWTPW